MRRRSPARPRRSRYGVWNPRRNLARRRVHKRYPHRSGKRPFRRNHGPPWFQIGLVALAIGLIALGTVGTTEPTSASSASVLSTSFFTEEEDDTGKPDFNPGKRSLVMDCAPGSDGVGVHNGYIRGDRMPMRLCALNLQDGDAHIHGIKGTKGRALVNAPASYQWVPLLTALRKAGFKPEAVSSFRTHQTQVQIFERNGRDRNVAAQPGFSNHQQGAAIDIIFPSGRGLRSCTRVHYRGEARFCKLPGDPMWRWFDKNSSRFGIYQFWNEYWHFSPSGH